MPFPEQTPKTFTRASIEALRSGQVGVYGLFRGTVWIYVGKGDIRQRLLDHLNGDNSCITRERSTHWVDVLTQGDPSERERQLILELTPLCNRRVG